MMNVINEEVECTLRIVANNCFIFQIPHVDNKVILLVFVGEHLQNKPRCTGNINCTIELDRRGVQVERDGLCLQYT